MSREFVNINSLYQNLYEDLEQLDEIGPVSRSQKLKDRQAKLNQQKSDWQARRSANNTPAPTPVAKPVAKPVAQAAPAPQQKVVSGQGNRQMPVKTGGIKPVSAIQGGLNRLGSLAGKAVGAARNVAGKVGNALSNKGPIQGRQQSQPVVQSRPAPQAQAQARPAQQARPASQGGGGSLTQAASNIDAMRSPASGSRQVKPGLIGKLLPNHPGNKGQQARPASQAQAQARPAQQARPASQAQAQARPASQARNISPADAAAKASPSGVTRTVNVQRDGNKVTRTTNTSADSSTKEGSAAVDAYKKAQAERMALRRANQNNSYELEGDLISDSFDITVDFLISEGHAADNSEAISIMTDPEFIAGFNAELNESSENNK